MKIGLSYDQGSPEYRLYTGALMAATGHDRANIDVQPFWLAGPDRALDTTALQTIDALLLTGGADVRANPLWPGQARMGSPPPDPARDESEWTILTAAFALSPSDSRNLSRDAALLNVFRGGTLVPHLPTVADHQLNDDARHKIVKSMVDRRPCAAHRNPRRRARLAPRIIQAVAESRPRAPGLGDAPRRHDRGD